MRRRVSARTVDRRYRAMGQDLARRAAEDARCAWDQDWEGNWDTACGEAFTFLEGGPSENKMAFCCYCGRPLQAVPYVEERTP